MNGTTNQTTKRKATLAAQTGVFRIDHRLVECRFYKAPGEYYRLGGRGKGKIVDPVVLIAVRDAGANMEETKSGLRSSFNRWGWSYVTESAFEALLVI